MTDPDAALARLLALFGELGLSAYDDDSRRTEVAAYKAWAVFDELDIHLRSGGNLPARWTVSPQVSPDS